MGELATFFWAYLAVVSLLTAFFLIYGIVSDWLYSRKLNERI